MNHHPQIQNQEAMLKESIKHFLTLHQTGCSDFSSLESIFFRLIQSMLDPPLEFTWFYSAVTFHSSKTSSHYTNNNPSTRLLVAKDLLNLTVSCSNLSTASKRIALLAPVVYELYNIVYDCTKSGVGVEYGRLVENVVSHVMMSAEVYDYGNVVEFGSPLVCFEDLVRVWTVDRGGGRCGFEEISRVFFPGLSDGIWKRVSSRCGVHELVGIVMCEVFFLRVYLSFGSGGEESMKDVENLAVQTIEGFRNCYFLDMLFKMLLEPSFPIEILLSSKDAVRLKKVLYDAVLLVHYSFFSGKWVDSSDNRLKKLAILWVLVADRAVQFVRETDKSSAMAYLNAFGDSQLVANLITWTRVQAAKLGQNTIPRVVTPKALIKWLLFLENEGVEVFDDSMSGILAKAVMFTSSVDNVAPQLNISIGISNRSDANKDKDYEMSDLTNNALPCKKRKVVLNTEQESQSKHMKLDGQGGSGGEKLGLHLGIEVVDLESSDDEMTD